MTDLPLTPPAHPYRQDHQGKQQHKLYRQPPVDRLAHVNHPVGYGDHAVHHAIYDLIHLVYPSISTRPVWAVYALRGRND